VSVHRRDFLGTLGAGSASTLLWVLGCAAPTQAVRRAPQVSNQVRLWLRDAVARLAAVYPSVHALAVSRRRTTVAHDVLGAGVARVRSDGVVFTVRSHDGARREHLASSLTAASIAGAITALGATRARAPIDFGRSPVTLAAPPPLDERDLRRRVAHLLHADAVLAPRIVYAAALVDHDDATVWSIRPGRDLEQSLVRIRQTVTRAAWNGPRPVVRHLERAWSGGLDDHTLTDAEIAATSEAVLEQMTPGTLEDGPRTVVLDPSVVALLFDAVARSLLAGRRAAPSPVAAPSSPAPAAAPSSPALLGSALITLIDDPTAAGAYGGFAFDDEGQPAAPITLIDAGRVVDLAASGSGRGRRAGHLAAARTESTHLVLSPGNVATSELYGDGFILEAGLDVFFDPASDRVRISCGRARELKAGSPTGRVYPDVELVGSLTALLAATDAISRAPVMFALDAPPSSGLAIPASPAFTDTSPPRWASIAAPALRTRGFVRARRSHA